MKKILAVSFLLSLMCVTSYSQSRREVRDSVRATVTMDARQDMIDSLRLDRVQQRIEKQVNFAESNTARWAVSANAGNFAFLFTLNAGVQYSIGRNFTAELTADVNPWTFKERTDGQYESRQQTYAAGARYWPWYTYSGWWFGAKGQYQEYNRGGIGIADEELKAHTEEGDAIGLALSAGYSVHIKKWLDIDFGFSVWGGRTWYTTYSCPHCGRIIDKGDKWFILPNQAIVAAMFIF